MKKFSPVLRKYEYDSSHVVTEKEKTYQDFDWTKFIYENEPSPIPVTVDKGVALITQQSNGDDRLYMLENIGNVRDELFDGVAPMKLNAYLPMANKKFYFRGEEITPVSDGQGTYTFDLKVGDAVFVEVLK